jgi:hypothetical protein
MVEFIGFVISLISILFLFFKNKYDQNRRNEQGKEEEFEDPLEGFFKSFEKREEPPPRLKPPVSPPAPVRSKRIEKKKPPRQLGEEYISPFRQASDQHVLEEKKAKIKPRAAFFLQNLSGIKNAIVCHEILSKPKGLRSFEGEER